MAHLMQPPPDPRDACPDLPLIVTATLMRAMAKRPEERFDTAHHFYEVLSTASVMEPV